LDEFVDDVDDDDDDDEVGDGGRRWTGDRRFVSDVDFNDFNGDVIGTVEGCGGRCFCCCLDLDDDFVGDVS
jgi:hypothetical protein